MKQKWLFVSRSHSANKKLASWNNGVTVFHVLKIEISKFVFKSKGLKSVHSSFLGTLNNFLFSEISMFTKTFSFEQNMLHIYSLLFSSKHLPVQS